MSLAFLVALSILPLARSVVDAMMPLLVKLGRFARTKGAIVVLCKGADYSKSAIKKEGHRLGYRLMLRVSSLRFARGLPASARSYYPVALAEWSKSLIWRKHAIGLPRLAREDYSANRPAVWPNGQLLQIIGQLASALA
jgi:hypothetical protein